MRWRDRILGIVIGIVLGLLIVTAFVFYGSEQTIDAPGVNAGAQRHGGQGPKPGPQPKPAPKPKPAQPKVPPVATVDVIGGAPPTSGPAHLDYKQGQRVRLRVVSDEDTDLQLLGYGISRSVTAGKPSLIAFTASKSGNFPLIVTASHIAVAQIRVGSP
jgi:hypothetical protein